MGSTMFYQLCPNCNEEATVDFYYHKQEEYCFCNSCGYMRTIELKPGAWRKTFDGITSDDYIVTVVHNPYGAFYYKYYSSDVGAQGTLKNEEEAKAFMMMCIESNLVSEAYIKRYEHGVITKNQIIPIVID